MQNRYKICIEHLSYNNWEEFKAYVDSKDYDVRIWKKGQLDFTETAKETIGDYNTGLIEVSSILSTRRIRPSQVLRWFAIPNYNEVLKSESNMKEAAETIKSANNADDENPLDDFFLSWADLRQSLEIVSSEVNRIFELEKKINEQ